MMSLVRTDSENKDFKALVKQLDAFLAVTDGDDHDFYNQYNKLDLIKHVVLIYVDNEPLACGAIKQYDITTMEIKRMFTSEKARGKGFASQILKALEIWAKELSFNRCILETGIRQVEAVHLYKKNNYKIIENYGQYSGLEESICFEKYLD